MNRSPQLVDPADLGSINIRAAVAPDAEAIASIYNHYVNAGAATFETIHWTIERVVNRIQSGDPDGWFVADTETGIVGWSAARRYSNRDGYRFSCETAIYIKPRAFGQGIAGKLQQRLEEHCRRCGLHHAVARIIADNDRSIAFHRRWGYEMVGIQKEIGRLNDQWLDVAIMQKLFT